MEENVGHWNVTEVSKSTIDNKIRIGAVKSSISCEITPGWKLKDLTELLPEWMLTQIYVATCHNE